MRRFALFALLASGCARAPSPAPSPPSAPAFHAGVHLFEATDPITHAALAAVAFYPTEAPARTTAIGPYTLAAAADAPIAEGRFPVVAISHGHLGTPFGHHDLATALAARGYVVVTVEHAGDSYRDASGVGTERVMLGRAYQISSLLDAALADSILATHVDASKIGVAGFSAGGYTALLLVGAKPDFSRLDSYCAAHPKMPDFCDPKPSMAKLDHPKPTVDPRVRAAFVMAPLGVFFGPGAFDPVKAPVFLADAEADQVLPTIDNADVVHASLTTLAGYRRVAKAGHFVFLAPCSDALANAAPELCRDPDGVDRVAVHTALNEDAARFFASALH